MSTSENNKRIAKNTILLYFRMLLLMFVSLYTSRVVLKALGVDDYGIYNVVGGMVAMFSLFSGSFTIAISRFITFELGKGDEKKLNSVFSTSVTIQLILGGLIILLSEPIGIWFLNHKMIIPEERLVAANFVLQFSIVTFFINLISVPYNAAIIAHEKMSAFAYISIIEALGKLLIAYLIVISPFDRLILYAFLMFFIALVVRFIYGSYCKKHFRECSYKFILDKNLLRTMFGFAGWNFLGSGSYILMTQGVNVLINMFFGVALNAARGIANQVDNALVMFANNFTTAINPQITKSYAIQDLTYMHQLICAGSKYSFFLLWIFALPVMLESDFILQIWLGTVPEFAATFLQYTLCISLLSVVSNTMVTSIQATGDIRNYQIIVGGLGMLVLPLAYVFYKLGFSVEWAYIIHFSIFVCQFISRLFLLKRKINLSIMLFLKETVYPDIKILIPSVLISSFVFYQFNESPIRFIIVLLTSFITNLICIYFLGLSKKEQVKFNDVLLKIKAKF